MIVQLPRVQSPGVSNFHPLEGPHFFVLLWALDQDVSICKFPPLTTSRHFKVINRFFCKEDSSPPVVEPGHV
jgi:hypothetical protein